MRIDPNGNAWWNWLVSGLQIAVGIALCATGVGGALGGILIAGGVMGIAGQIIGTQITGGIGSMMNGWGAISTGINLLSFGPWGIAAGIALIAVGAVTMIMGGNEVVSGVTGTNYTRDWMGSGLYDGLCLGLNIASSVGTFAGNIGMRIASNNILNNLVKNPTKIQNYSLRQIKTYGKYTSQFNVGTMQKGNHAGQGYTLTNISGKGGGYIQYHPGNSTWHALKNPYFKISSNYVQ